MRGLKRAHEHKPQPIFVASFTDAWIETRFHPFEHEYRQSHLLQMRGLKQICHRIKRGSRRVASFTDAWIETLFFVNTQEE